MLRLERLHIRVGGFELRSIDLEVREGDYFVLLGASGSGKTVLLETLAGLHRPVAGRILVDGSDISRDAIQERPMALVYQDQALFPHLSVRRNVAYGLERLRLDRQEKALRLQELERTVGIGALDRRMPATLSGGEAQRVALARALARQPRYLLLDEPLSSLDCGARSGLRRLLRSLHRQGRTLLHVTHDFEEALALASRVAVLESGRIVQTGTPLEVFRHPRSQFVARFVGLRNVFQGRLESCDEGGVTMGRFHVEDHVFSVMTDEAGGPGCLLFRGEDVCLLSERPRAELPNLCHGRVTEVTPARAGLEIGVDIGVEIVALLGDEEANRLRLRPGREVWVSISSAAGRYIAEAP